MYMLRKIVMWVQIRAFVRSEATKAQNNIATHSDDKGTRCVYCNKQCPCEFSLF